MTRRRVRARGSVAVELVLLTPLFILLLLAVVALGRIAESRSEVDGAAEAAARAASIARAPAAAIAAAQATAADAVGHRGVTCRRLTVTVDTTAFRPGGWVSAQVSCLVDLSDVVLLRMPGTTMLTARFVSPIDLYQEGT